MKYIGIYFTREDPPCPTCDRCRPEVRQLRQVGVPVIELDVNDHTDIFNTLTVPYGIRSIPVFFLLNVEELAVGSAISSQIRSLLANIPQTETAKGGKK